MNNAAVITAYKEYMEVRKMAVNGLIGHGAVRLYAERLRAAYRAAK